MRTKVTLVLLFLNLLLFLFIFRFERAWRTELAEQEVRHRVLGAEAADPTSITVAAPGESYRLERRAGSWRLTQPFDWPANPAAVDRIRTDLQLLDDETSFSVKDMLASGQSLADYGLDHPAMTVTLAGPRGGAVLRIGNVTKVGQRLYLLSSDGSRVHVVGRAIVDSLTLPLDRLRSDDVLTIPVYEARSLNLLMPGHARVRIQRDGERWSFETPVPARADAAAVEIAINALGRLRVRSFAPDSADAQPEPAREARITVEGNNRAETLYVGGPVPGAAASGGEVRYAQLEDPSQPSGRSVRFTAVFPAGLWQTLGNAAVDLRDRHVLELDTGAVTGIEIQSPPASDVVLRRLEPGAGQPGWQLVLPPEGGRGPRTIAADAGAVRRLLDYLGGLTATRFASDAPTDAERERWGLAQPERRIILAAGRVTQTLEVGRPDPASAEAFVQLASGLSVYAVAPEIFRETPALPGDWRDRQLMNLPDSARLVAASLTDLATGKVLWGWGQPVPGGAPAVPASRLGAIAALDREWRGLRAARFGPGEFTAEESPAGPWAYRLEGTFLLPGGGRGDARIAHVLYLTARLGGTEQWGGAPEFGSAFELEQPLIDALWTLTYGDRDPGPPPQP